MVLRLSATFVFALFFSCKKKQTSIGSSSIDQNEILNSSQVDTFSLTTFTELEDSVITSSPPSAMLGSYNDPKFGTTNASFFTQLRLPAINPTFGDLSTIIIDSFVLGLQYNGYYGDLTTQTFQVFQLTDSLDINTKYYAFSDKAHSSTNLIDPSKQTIKPDPYTQIVIDTSHVKAQLRLFLDTNLAKSLLVEATNNPTSFSSNDNFLNYFKGLHVSTNNGFQAENTGGVLFFDLDDPLSKLTIYYRQAGVKKTYDFLINTSCAKFNKVEINNAGKNVQNVINTPSLGQSQFYAQALKSRAVVQLPGILNLPKKSIIHEAKLILPIEYQVGYKYTPGSQISISTKMEDGTNRLYSVIDNGTYDAVNKQYTVDLKTYIQAILSEERYPVNIDGTSVYVLTKGTQIYISPSLFNSSSDRIIFNGSNTTNKIKPKLILKYTEF
jgi:hypothetical protein